MINGQSMGAKCNVTFRWACSAFWIMLFSLIPKGFLSLYIYVFRFASRSKEKGTYEEFDMILAALLEETFVREFAIGEGNLTPTTFMKHLLANLERPFIDLVNKEPSRNLNHYIEAQVHGDIFLEKTWKRLLQILHLRERM